MEEEMMKETPDASVPAEGKPKKKFSLPRGKKGRRWVRVLVVLVLVAAIAAGVMGKLGGSPAAAGAVYVASPVVRQDLTVSVSGTATLMPADAYNVSTLLSTTVVDAPFEEGDLVTRDTLLYALDSGDARGNVDRANISVQQAQMSYDQAKEAMYPTATLTGTINEVLVRDGDSVTAGTALCKIVASTDLTIDFLFTYVSPDQFYVGQPATVFIGNFDGSVPGTVASVSNDTAVTSNGMQSCTVRVKVANPGIVSTAFTASAVIGSYSSYGNAPVSMAASSTVYAAGSGTVTGFTKLSGSTVTRGETLCTIDSESVRDAIQSARLSLESARLSASTASDSLDDYNIKSPINGTVIEKKLKAGDKVDGATTGTMAVIYDLSYLKMQMNVDELNIGKVQAGQTVEIAASALPGQTFTGRVDKVSINGTTTNGFTTYPVTIVLEEYGELKPGMNVSADIQGETVKNALCVPVAAVDRGNTVLVAQAGALAEDGVTVADPAKAETRPVGLGINDDTYIEITSGLEEGETVLVQSQADPMAMMMGG